jgi:site-specific recombinase XerD
LDAIYNYLDARIEAEGQQPKADAPLFASAGNRNASGRMTERSISRIVKDAFKGIGLNSARLTAHSLRHTAVTFALLGGATVQDTQAMARHESINTTMIYAHNLQRVKNGAEFAVDRVLQG